MSEGNYGVATWLLFNSFMIGINAIVIQANALIPSYWVTQYNIFEQEGCVSVSEDNYAGTTCLLENII